MLKTVIANRVPVSSTAYKTSHTHKILEGIVGIVEACSDFRNNVVPTEYHGLIHTAQIAFSRHYPLVLTPDAIWITIAQGVASHINQNAETLRKEFVSHEGKELIKVRRDGYIKGSPENDWQDAFAEFSDKIKAYIGEDTHQRFIADFSTTGPVEKAASEVVLMDAMKNYFDYLCKTMCGIPYVAVEGNSSDWKKILKRTEEFGKYGLTWWTDVVCDIISHIVDAVEGRGSESFWADIFNEGGGSGGPYYNGWICKLLPYNTTSWNGRIFKNHLVEKHFEAKKYGSMFNGISPENMPSSLSSCPFKWEYYHQNFDMRFIAGIAGAEQDEDSMALRPKVVWAVQDMAHAKVKNEYA